MSRGGMKRTRSKSSSPLSEGSRPRFLTPSYYRLTQGETSIKISSKFGEALKRRQIRAKRRLHNVFGLQVSMTLGKLSTQKSLRRVTNCITSHTGIMGITKFPAGEGIAVCIYLKHKRQLLEFPTPNDYLKP